MKLKQNQRYQATVVLSTIEAAFANPQLLKQKLVGAGFAEVEVKGSGKEYTATGRWPGQSVDNAPLPKQVQKVIEI